MYMSVPAQASQVAEIKEKHEHVFLHRVISPLENKLSSDEYSRLWQELLHSGRDLDQLYEECRSGTYLFKDMYDSIKKTEQLNEALRQTYYNALSTKKKHEEDRDVYFKCDKDLIAMKEDFIEETQKLALSNSKYIEYNQRFAIRREQLISQVLAEVNSVNAENNKLKADKEHLNRELGESRMTVYNIREELSILKKDNELLEGKCKTLESKRDQLKKELEWMTRQNNKLKESNARCEREISSLNAKLEELTDLKNTKELREKRLLEENNDLELRCIRLQQLVDGVKEQLRSLEAETTIQKEKWQEEKKLMNEEVSGAKKKLEAAKLNNHNTIIRNQQLREKLKTANHKVEKATKEKLSTALKEHRTRKTNVELATHQLELINEILELKNDFFKDQARIREGGRLNRKLEKNIEILRQRMQLLKENPSAVDPLDGAQEYREQTRLKFTSKKKTA